MDAHDIAEETMNHIRIMKRHKPGITLLLLAALCVFQPISAATPEIATLQLLPATGIVAPGERVIVELWLHDVANLYGLDVQVQFNPQQAQGIEPLLVDTSFFSPDFILYSQINNHTGILHYVGTRINPSIPISGTGRLFSVEMQLQQPGSVALTVLPTSLLSTRDGEPIPFAIENAAYTVEGSTIFLPFVVKLSQVEGQILTPNQGRSP